jgi:peptidyl-dipeptidase Dcp
MTNPLLADWTAEFALPPFDAIRDEDFAPAFEAALEEARTRIGDIAGNAEAPTFANTIAAMELAEALLDRVGGVFYNLAGSDATPARVALQRDLAPKMAAFSTEVLTNPALWARVRTLWEARETLGLDAEQARVLELYRRMFVRAGADLAGAARDRMAAVKERLAVITTQFSQNILAEERDWHLPVTEADLQGLPDFVVATAKAAAEERGRPGYCRRYRNDRRGIQQTGDGSSASGRNGAAGRRRGFGRVFVVQFRQKYYGPGDQHLWRVHSGVEGKCGLRIAE